ncbi:elongation of very long chain fatty acids protein-like [Bradysia coprophila]|uniref:elongation of very long chain fatty acids protein-like n=1 Tax=Bradysia coprophila TaxID=38358 RepID=UPI00187DB43C|nr:elongation of very long chain fatty acids protein-like [Bradysia coprophila]
MSNDYSLLYTIDPTVAHFTLVHYPYIVSLIPILYLFVVLKWGPDLMKTRPAYDLKGVILFYNLSQIIMNIYLISLGLSHMLKKNYFEMRNEPLEGTLAYYYFLLKIYDLLETLIFVLRKKQQQVSFLHVYHHIMVLLFIYFGMRSMPGGHNVTYGFVNTVVHAFMYCYYFLAAYDSSIKWLPKCKKFITQIQLLQFVILLIHYSWPLYYGHCCVSQIQCKLNVIQALVMIVLFGNFYIKNYIKKKK